MVIVVSLLAVQLQELDLSDNPIKPGSLSDSLKSVQQLKVMKCCLRDSVSTTFQLK